MRRVLLTLIVAAVALALPAAAASAADQPRLTLGGEARFPERSFLLSLPGDKSVDPTAVRVTENGEPVHELNVVATKKAGAGSVATVLVVDASSSMRGKPIRQALAAARAFARYRQPDQKIGVVMFNRKVSTTLDPTTDAPLIDTALSTVPKLAPQARVYDGVNVAVSMLQRQRVDVGSVVLLSDCATTCKDGKLGAPAGGRAGATAGVSGGALTARAKARGVRVFTVGLRPEQAEAQTLQALAAATGGDYSAASSAADLKQIYGQLGSRIANEYVVSYTSVEGRGRRIRVQADVDGYGTAALDYSSPRLRVPPPERVVPKANGFWASPLAMVAVCFGTAFLFCFGVAMAMSARRRTQTVDERVKAFVAMGDGQRPGRTERDEPTGLFASLEERLRRRDWWNRFCLEVEVGRIEMTPIRIAILTLLGTLFTMWLFTAISGQGWVGIFALVIPFVVRWAVRRKCMQQRIAFSEQLADNLQVLASAMRAGQSFGGALAVAVEDAPEPARDEFQRVVSDEQLGVPIDQSLGAVAVRMDNRDLQQVQLVASLQREAGGNSAEVLDRVADTIRDRVALRRLIRTLTAQGRMSRWIVTLVPVALVIFIALTRPGYLDPLMKTTFGNVLLVIAVLMVASGSFVIKKIVEIEI